MRRTHKDLESFDDTRPHETVYTLFKVNGGSPVELETALALAEGHLSGRFEFDTKTDTVTIQKVRVRQTIQIVEENEGQFAKEAGD